MNIRIKNISEKQSYLPKYQSVGAVGFDLCAAIDRAIELGPNNRQTIGTGLCFEVPPGFELQIRPRSGLASGFGVNAILGTVDSDYRGEVKVILQNTGRTSYVVGPGDRIAQGVIVPVTLVEFEVVEELTKTERGTRGFGSTGR